MSTYYAFNNSQTFSSSSGHLHNPASAVSLHSTVTIIAGIAVLSAVIGGTKWLQSIFFAMDRFFGGATHNVALPGPTGLPLVGNLYQMMEYGHVQMLAKWIKMYGPVIRVGLGEREAVFINTHQAMAQTVVAQGMAFQSRPTFKLFHNDFASSGIWTIGTSPYSDSLARTRKALSTQITPRLLPDYIPIFYPQLRRLVSSVSHMSNDAVIDLAEILHYFGTGTVMEQLVGTPLSEALISHIAYNEMEVFRQRTIGSPAHDYIPIMRAWNKTIDRVASTLGLQYGRNKAEVHAKEYRRFQEVYINDLVAGLRKRIEGGDETPSYLGNIMRTTSLNDEEILLSSYTVASTGVNVAYTLTWVTGYLANHPEMQDKAYEAIHEVYQGSVPNPHEFDRVEYIKALHTASEGSRYYVPVRFGFPRQTASEATYNGVTIPAGVLVVMNCFACNRDPAVYNSPDEFIPERWMNGNVGRTDNFTTNTDKLGMPHLTYGAGRRVCPGSDIANRELYATLLLLLHFFKWERRALGEQEKQHVFAPFRVERECTADMDPLTDSATPTEAQAIPWACGLKFTHRDPEALAEWLAQEE